MGVPSIRPASPSIRWIQMRRQTGLTNTTNATYMCPHTIFGPTRTPLDAPLAIRKTHYTKVYSVSPSLLRPLWCQFTRVSLNVKPLSFTNSRRLYLRQVERCSTVTLTQFVISARNLCLMNIGTLLVRCPSISQRNRTPLSFHIIQ